MALSAVDCGPRRPRRHRRDRLVEGPRTACTPNRCRPGHAHLRRRPTPGPSASRPPTQPQDRAGQPGGGVRHRLEGRTTAWSAWRPQAELSSPAAVAAGQARPCQLSRTGHQERRRSTGVDLVSARSGPRAAASPARPWTSTQSPPGHQGQQRAQQHAPAGPAGRRSHAAPTRPVRETAWYAWTRFSSAARPETAAAEDRSLRVVIPGRPPSRMAELQAVVEGVARADRPALQHERRVARRVARGVEGQRGSIFGGTANGRSRSPNSLIASSASPAGARRAAGPERHLRRRARPGRRGKVSSPDQVAPRA